MTSPKSLVKKCRLLSRVNSISNVVKYEVRSCTILNVCCDGDLLPVPAKDASDESSGKMGELQRPRYTAKRWSPMNVSEH